RVATADQAGADRPASGWNEHAVADDDLPLPRTAVIATQIDEAVAVNGGVLHGQNPGADGVDAHVSEGGVADGGIGNPHVGVEARPPAIVVQKVLAVIGCDDPPVRAVVDVIRLAAADERHIEATVDQYD